MSESEIEQLRRFSDQRAEALERMTKERDDLKAKLAAFEQAMEKEKKPDWSKQLKECADSLDALAKYTEAPRAHTETMRFAARQLRYMADSFTLKANFVPRDLRIKELEAKLAQVEADAESYFVDIVGIVEIICGNESKGLYGLRVRERIIRLLSQCGAPNGPKVSVPTMREGEAQQENERPELALKTAGQGKKVQCEPPGSTQGSGQASQENQSASERTRQGTERPLQGKVPVGVEERSSKRESGETKTVSGVRLGRISSRASQRLQQALSSGVALQLMSREEAQAISDRLNGSGQRLLDEIEGLTRSVHASSKDIVRLENELATLRATAQRRLELLRKCEWSMPCAFDFRNQCPICQGYIAEHKPNCPLAQELKEGE